MRIKSKGRGRSGGARVITLIENFVIAELDESQNETTVNLISIYDKADTDTISDNEIKRLVSIYRSE